MRLWPSIVGLCILLIMVEVMRPSLEKTSSDVFPKLEPIETDKGGYYTDWGIYTTLCWSDFDTTLCDDILMYPFGIDLQKVYEPEAGSCLKRISHMPLCAIRLVKRSRFEKYEVLVFVTDDPHCDRNKDTIVVSNHYRISATVFAKGSKKAYLNSGSFH